MENDTDLAKRVFPGSSRLIDDLAARSESFRDLCSDFAVADELMRRWATSNAPGRDERHAEFVELVGGLRKEIADVLANAT